MMAPFLCSPSPGTGLTGRRRRAQSAAREETRLSRLDSNIRRLEAQRACLNMAAERLRHLPGPVIELGLGNGRTYDHLREVLPDREIFVFDRQVGAHPDCIPDPEHLLLGEIRETLPGLLARMPGKAALAHSDLGTADAAANGVLAAWLAEALPPLLLDGAWVISDRALPSASLRPQPLPPGIAPDRYFVYRHEPK
jgi:S-adenosyl-L-methionine methyltransferase